MVGGLTGEDVEARVWLSLSEKTPSTNDGKCSCAILSFNVAIAA